MLEFQEVVILEYAEHLQMLLRSLHALWKVIHGYLEISKGHTEHPNANILTHSWYSKGTSILMKNDRAFCPPRKTGSALA